MAGWGIQLATVSQLDGSVPITYSNSWSVRLFGYHVRVGHDKLLYVTAI